MDNKRILLATLLCFITIIGWQFFAEYMGWIPATETTQVAVEQVQETPLTDEIFSSVPEMTTPQALFAPAPGESIIVDTPLYTAKFHSGGGILESFTLKNFKQGLSPDSPNLNMITPEAATISPMGVLINGQPSWSMGTWTVSHTNTYLASGETAILTFKGEMDTYSITREITFHADTYLMSETLTLHGKTTSPILSRVGYNVGVTSFSSEKSSHDPMKMVWNMDGKFKDENSVKKLTKEGILEQGPIYFGGLMNNYFLSAVAPVNKEATLKGRIQNNVWRVALETPTKSTSMGSPISEQVTWWFGPKDKALLTAAPNDLISSIDMGTFGFLARPLVTLLSFFHGFLGNWGVAIIFLTLLIKIIFWPLTRKSYKSMEQMKKIQPMMKEIQDKYPDDKQAMSREVMQLYKTYNVNPMSGCLPMLVQLPVFIALYQTLLNAIDLRHAAFITYLPFTDILWLADLSVKDPLYITPLLMGATMFLQQKLAPAMGDPMQRKVMMFMPVIFTFMFLQFPAGLVLYWLCNNVLSIAQQWWTLRDIK